MNDAPPKSKILIVEDEALVAKTIARQLDRMGFHVIAIASTGEEALERAGSCEADLVLMDIHLSGEFDGVETALRLKSQLNVPVVYLTGYSDAETWERARKTGPFGYLVKPYDPQELQSTIEMALHQHEMAKRISESETRYRTLSELICDFAYSIRVSPDGESEEEWCSSSIQPIYCLILPNIDRPGCAERPNLHPADQEVLEVRMKELLAGRAHVCEFRAMMQSGEVRWLRDYATPIVDPAYQRVVRIIGAIQEITDRVRAEEALRQVNNELEQYIVQLTQRNREISLLNEMGLLLQSCISLQDVYAVLGDFAERLFPGLSGRLAMFTEARGMLETTVAWGSLNKSESNGYPQTFDPSSCWALRRGQIHFVEHPNTRLRCQHIPKQPFSPYLCALVTAGGDSLGVLTLAGQPAQPLRSWEPLVQTVTQRIALALANLNLREKLRQQSIRDPLTGLYNRRYMEQALERELHRATRHNRTVSVAMLDLDRFKPINDRFGHDAGDMVLQEIARFLNTNLRSEDIVCRYGGDEFALILTETTPAEAIHRFEALGRGICDLRLIYQGELLSGISVSIGLASYPQHGKTPSEVLHAADTALYKAKAQGRSRIVISEAV